MADIKTAHLTCMTKLLNTGMRDTTPIYKKVNIETLL